MESRTLYILGRVEAGEVLLAKEVRDGQEEERTANGVKNIVCEG